MKGIPKFFNTKEDIYNSLEEDKDATIEHLKKMYNERFIWKDDGVIDKKELIEDESHKGIYLKKDTKEDSEEELHQFSKVVDKNFILYMIGMTDKEIKEIIGDEK